MTDTIAAAALADLFDLSENRFEKSRGTRRAWER
jgi:hypothetical protein